MATGCRHHSNIAIRSIGRREELRDQPVLRRDQVTFGLADRPRVWKAWQRPTLPCLKTQYHWRRGFSRPSSEWDRVYAPRNYHQAVETRGCPNLTRLGRVVRQMPNVV